MTEQEHNDLDDFDDLDDLLDEDPSKLENNETEQGGDAEKTCADSKSEVADGLNNGSEKDLEDSQEMKTMVEQLQSEFDNLMVNDPSNVNEEVVGSFRELMRMLNNTTNSADGLDNDVSISSNGDSKQPPVQKGDFKSIVQSTLHKIKENGNNVDSEIKEEKKKATEKDLNNPNIVQEALLNKVFSELTASGMDENIDDTILKLLNEMSNKDIIYQPMKDLYAEYVEFFEDYEKFESEAAQNDPKIISSDEMTRYRNQSDVVNKLLNLLEREDFNDTTHKSQVSGFLDELEKLGESPMSSKFMKNLKGDSIKSTNDTSLPDFDNLDLENIDLKDIEKEMRESCPQQ